VKRYGWLIALGILTALAFGLATLPANVATGRLARLGVQAETIGGSVWTGTATGVSWRGAQIGQVTWRIAPAALFRGHLAGHLQLLRADGQIATEFDSTWSGASLRLAGTTLDLPIEAVSMLPLGMPKGWQGRVTGRFDEVRIENGWPAALHGTLDLDGLVAPPPRSAVVGNFHAVLPHPRPQASATTGAALDPGAITAQVADKDGPFAVDGQLTIGRDRSFLFEGLLAPRGPVPSGMERSLQLLGPPDASGRRPFSVGGTL
jgi:hypothetical protein